MDNPYDQDDHRSSLEDIAILCLIYAALILVLIAVDMRPRHLVTAPVLADLTEEAAVGERRLMPTTAGMKRPPSPGAERVDTQLDVIEAQPSELRCRHKVAEPNARYCSIKR